MRNDIPRVGHDLITLAQTGLLIEEERTNNLIRSNAITDGWSKARATITDSTEFPIFANEGFLDLQAIGLVDGRY